MSAAVMPDLDARRRALDPARSYIVQAPAGSGKTELLIQRYLGLLSSVKHPEEIVAITFTRKAAGEMRGRVLRALADSRSGASAGTGHERVTLGLAGSALARDAENGWDLIENPARLRIQTMDALCSALTRQMPVLSRFGAQPESVEDASDLYLEAARATVALVEGEDATGADVERLLAHLDNDRGRVEALLAGMLARRDHWLRHVHGTDRDRLEGALRRVRHGALERARELLPAAWRAEWRMLADYAFGNLGYGAFADETEDWERLARVFLREDGGWRKSFTKNQGFPTGRPAQAWKDRVGALVEALQAHDAFRGALSDMRGLPPGRYTEDQWEVLGAIARLLPVAVGQLKVVFQSRGQVDFTEVSQGALAALGEPEAPSDLALALDYRIRHLLVDEFQDTSISQYELIGRLTAGWEPGDGRTVFAVGDPMQSIYRFREAEVGQFLRARREGLGSVLLEPIALSANFRSQAGIVEWVNATFARVLPEREDVGTGAVPYTPSTAVRAGEPGPPVEVHPFFGSGHDAEAGRVVELVRRARAGNPAGTVAILVRNRGHLREIVPRLKEAGLRFRAIEIEELGHRPVVQDLLALTRALTHPADRLAWLAVLRAPWCGLTLADLVALAGAGDRRTVWESMNDDALTATLGDDGRARLARVRTVVAASMADRLRGPLRARVAGAWFALGGPACVEDTTDLEDAEIFFDYLESHEQGGEIANATRFEEGLSGLYALPDLQADERLQVMTIHKAKGLEFDTVIVPGLGRAPRAEEARLFLWTEQPRGEGRTDLLLAPIDEAGTDGDLTYRWLRRLDMEKERLESCRLLYVAATRAREGLHLLGAAKIAENGEGTLELRRPGERTLLRQLWPVLEPVYAGAAARSPGAGEAGAADAIAIDQSLRRVIPGWQLPPPPSRVSWDPPREPGRERDEIEFSWAGETARHVGSVVHRWLQRIAEDGLARWDAGALRAVLARFGDELAACGLPPGEAGSAAARVAGVLERTLASDRGRWLLGDREGARSELRLTGVTGDGIVDVVVDRTFVDEGTRWIVDYKTGGHEGGDVAAFLDREQERYRPQLERYARFLRAIEDRPIRLGLYFPLLDGWREWEHAPGDDGARGSGAPAATGSGR
ncbi:MAG: UvrD-helicase domain-containing protein [Burkholderiales bacterium]|nr:UvrD-helicase domain-containing protein [Burkholderiales bacterium]